jgi:hypothetical protein
MDLDDAMRNPLEAGLLGCAVLQPEPAPEPEKVSKSDHIW